MRIPFPFVRRYDTPLLDLTASVLLSAELCGVPMSRDAAAMLVHDLLMTYSKEQIFAALARCRVGTKGGLGYEIRNSIQDTETKINGVGSIADVGSIKGGPFFRSDKVSKVINTASDEAWVLDR